MKRTFLSIAFIIFITVLYAQKAEEKDLKALMTDLGYSWSETKSTMLHKGESEYFWRTFYSGNEYAILVFSENKDVFDLDLYLYNEEGNLLDKSISKGNFEIIEFALADVSQTKIVLKNYNCAPEQAEYRCKFMIFYK